MANDMLSKVMPEVSKAFDLLHDDIKAMADQNIELVFALHKCRTVLDEIWLDPEVKEEHHLWVQDQKDAIELADAVLAKVRGDAQ